MFIEDVILKDRSEPRRGDTAPLPRPCVAPTGLDRILRRSVFYKHAAPLQLQTAGHRADERTCCVWPNRVAGRIEPPGSHTT